MSEPKKIVIVGGVAGGATAAARIRRLDEHARIIMFERTGFISYANCGLPYFIGGVIKNQDELTLQTPGSFGRRFRVEARVRCEVQSIHPENKTVTVCDLESGTVWEESYDQLLLSPGAKAMIPDIKGTDADEVFTLRTVEDTFAIHQYVKERKPKNVFISGGGFIGLELAENLAECGLEVTVAQRSKQVMKLLDPEMAGFLHTELRKNGVKLLFGDTANELKAEADGLCVQLTSGASLHADMVVLATGVVPESKLAKEAGLELGKNGSILVNDRMETSVKDIYAVGDAVQVKQRITGTDVLIPLAGPANRQGRIAADNICGGNSTYPGTLGTSVLKVFGMTAACCGINEKTAKEQGIACDKVFLSPASHASYYPGGKVMTMKVLFEKETFKLLGAQIVGYEGVDKRMDVLATAMCANLGADCLKDLELAYAPPYSSAKDPVNMAGFMIDNIKNGTLKQFFTEDCDQLPRDGSVTLLDTRTPGEYRRGFAEGFINIPVDELRERIGELEHGKPVYVMCQSGLRSYIACRILMQEGFDAYNFSGGYRLYAAIKADQALACEATACGMDR